MFYFTVNLYSYGFVHYEDKKDYLKSLHLPSNTEGADQFPYTNIPGDDQPGDYRRTGVAYVPIIAEKTNSNLLSENLDADYLYYFEDTQQYYRYVEGLSDPWVLADKGFVNKVLDDKAYIDMPNLDYFTFLNPRDIFWGLKISFDL